MLQPIDVTLVAYEDGWPKQAAQYEKQLEVLGLILVTTHHIGSTSVPGLMAKPIIDLLPVVTSLHALDRNRARVEALGFQWHGEFGIAGRRYCTLHGSAGERLAQLHFFREGSPEIMSHLVFRDYLRVHPEEAHAYAIEKSRARELHPTNSHAYTDEKVDWITQALARALEWQNRALEASAALIFPLV